MLDNVNSRENAYRVHSVDRAIDILDSLAESRDALTITQLAESVGGSKSAVFSTAQTLVARGFVLSTGSGLERRYQLGLSLTRLGELALDRFSFGSIAKPVLEELTSETGLTSRAASWGGDSAIAVARVDGRGTVKFDLHMGQSEYLHCSSVGKAMLSTYTDEEVSAIMTNLPFVRRTGKTITSLPKLLVDLAHARTIGYAVDDEEDAEGIICIGAPVLDAGGVIRGAISVTRIKGDISAPGIHALGTTTTEYAGRLSSLLRGAD
jgi:IclR family transcriptional regulator, acetate operon repressor